MAATIHVVETDGSTEYHVQAMTDITPSTIVASRRSAK